jgi:hypothetical protein
MEQKKSTTVLKTVLPIVLGGAILYWMYRDFDFSSIRTVLWEEMSWTWMLLSMPFGVLAQALRGWRWRQTLEPLREGDGGAGDGGAGARGTDGTGWDEMGRAGTEEREVRNSVCVNAVFLSYAASLVVPRIGEFTRCGVVKRWEGLSFTKALGTVVTERVVDTLVVLLYSAVVLLVEMSTFGTFFRKTGTSVEGLLSGFSAAGYLVTGVCAVAVALLLHLLLRRLSIYNKVKATMAGLWEGVLSLRDVKNLPLYLVYSVAIWVAYFLHFYLTFFCFDFTADLGIGCAVVCFVVANFAVIVPTPNGAGPWHFAIKTMLILYGVEDEQALYFVLIVHTLQTLLVVLLGVWAWLRLSFVGDRRTEVLKTK